MALLVLRGEKHTEDSVKFHLPPLAPPKLAVQLSPWSLLILFLHQQNLDSTLPSMTLPVLAAIAVTIPCNEQWPRRCQEPSNIAVISLISIIIFSYTLFNNYTHSIFANLFSSSSQYIGRPRCRPIIFENSLV